MERVWGKEKKQGAKLYAGSYYCSFETGRHRKIKIAKETSDQREASAEGDDQNGEVN